MPSRRRAWLINLAVILVAALVIMLGVGVRLPDGALVGALVFGVPLLLVVITATIASRRAR
jgi:multisubunit Na+/H+ antiporter MnhB subunit